MQCGAGFSQFEDQLKRPIVTEQSFLRRKFQI